MNGLLGLQTRPPGVLGYIWESLKREKGKARNLPDVFFRDVGVKLAAVETGILT
jgi:hypothetical protein